MRYISTRGGGAVSFETAVLEGLARDGGLFLPNILPDARAALAAWARLDYRALAGEVMGRFAPLDPGVLRDLIARGTAAFRHREIAPVAAVGPLFVLELFHGPTLAFKDIALQFLGPLFEHFLARSGKRLNLLAATSGDTGSAAIAGVRGCRGLRLVVLYPEGRLSPLQERQMTTVADANVATLALRGSFDDCQAIVKTLFNDLAFRDRHALGAVNSINWARLLAQVVYYVYGVFRVLDLTGAAAVQVAVPTGNFGDLFAGLLAVRLGAPISRLIVATNENDILARFFETGIYARGPVRASLSPSMDIQVASNFERYLYLRLNGDAAAVRARMAEFAASGRLALERDPGQPVDPLIAAGACDTAGTLEVIREVHARYGYLLDPHTAVGVGVGRRRQRPGDPLLCLDTAHPAKFPAAVRRATGRDLDRHPVLDALRGLPGRRTVLPADPAAVRAFVARFCPAA